MLKLKDIYEKNGRKNERKEIKLEKKKKNLTKRQILEENYFMYWNKNIQKSVEKMYMYMDMYMSMYVN